VKDEGGRGKKIKLISASRKQKRGLNSLFFIALRGKLKGKLRRKITKIIKKKA